MAQSKAVQVACSPNLYEKLSAYRSEKKLSSDADAMRELTLFALRILEHADDKSEGITTRELLEVLLENVMKIHHQTSINYYQNYDENQYNVNIQCENVVPSYKKLMLKAEERTERLLAGDTK